MHHRQKWLLKMTGKKFKFLNIFKSTSSWICVEGGAQPREIFCKVCCNCWPWQPFTFSLSPGSTPMTSESSKAFQQATKSSRQTMTGMTRTQPCQRVGSRRLLQWIALARWSSQWDFWALTGDFAHLESKPSSTYWRMGVPTTMIWCECRWGCYRSVLNNVQSSMNIWEI